MCSSTVFAQHCSAEHKVQYSCLTVSLRFDFISLFFFFSLCVCVFFGLPFSHCLDDQQIRLFSDMTLSDHSPRDFSQDGVDVKNFN